GTVAIIQEYKAKGPLTNVLYSIVGLDDGLGVLIFGFAAALAKSLLSGAKLNNFKDFIMLFYHPFLEITLSVILGLLFGVIFAYLAKKLRNPRDLFILTFGSILLLTGFCIYTNLSYIMANMLFGVFIINTQKNTLVKNLKEQLSNTMPLLFVMFFVLGGAHLELGSLLKLGMLGLIYTFTRTFGKISGCYVGAVIGKSDNIIKKYSGIGIISQAGLAIGLSLIVKHELAEISPAADAMGTTIVTVVAATCIIFEIVGPLAAKYALQKAGEIPENTI
ncbi:MAG: hypothetical protein WC002_10555, partial [Candidatus Muiribacteriota bacterium]